MRAGVGLKPGHFRQIIEQWPDLGFFEVHAENYLVAGGPLHYFLTQIRERYALSVHGVGLSIGGEEPIDRAHLDRLRRLLDRYAPQSFSEHLAWSTHGGVFVNDLLPVSYDQGTLVRVCAHIEQIQDYLGRRMLLENPATYLEFTTSIWDEPDFIAEVVHRTGCGLLLDVNNIHVSCTNHGRDPRSYLLALPLASVGEIHLAGFAQETDALGAPLLIDNHGFPVSTAVWALYDAALVLTGPQPTLLERDNDIPPFSVLYAESQLAEQRLRSLATGFQGGGA